MWQLFRNSVQAIRNYPKWYRSKTKFLVPYRIRAAQTFRKHFERFIDSKSMLAYMKKRYLFLNSSSLV